MEKEGLKRPKRGEYGANKGAAFGAIGGAGVGATIGAMGGLPGAALAGAMGARVGYEEARKQNKGFINAKKEYREAVKRKRAGRK